MNSLALLLIGHSLFSALVLMLTHFRAENYPDQAMARRMGIVLMLALSGLQLAHFAWLGLDWPWVQSAGYRIALFAVAPAFFLFSRPLLSPAGAPTPVWLAHGAPVLIAALLPGEVALPAAFAVGGLYLLWLGVRLFGLRAERVRFRREIVILGGVFCVAVVVAVLGCFQAMLPDKTFYALYAMAIGFAFLLVQLVLGLRPHLPTEVVEVAQSSYANSTLSAVDCDAVLSALHRLMADEHIYRDADLSLARLAERVGLRPHQLSELLNARVGQGFSRYLREQRVQAARVMLMVEPSASVLSVGLSVGFTAQSNFYEAFREICGMTPGQYRKTARAPVHPSEETGKFTPE